MNDTPAIQLMDISYTYPGAETLALSNVSIDIQRGEVLGIIGANGSGKSTLCYLLAGLIPNFFNGSLSGSMLLDHRDILSLHPADLPNEVGLVMQNSRLQLSHMRTTVREEVAFSLENLGVPAVEMETRVQKALRAAGISHLADRSPFTLSGGEQQRLAIASILVMNAPLLIFDEPTSLLDPVGRREVLSVISDLTHSGHTIVIAEHFLEWIAEFTDRVLALDAGKVLAYGKPDEVLNLPEIQSAGIGRTRFTQSVALYLSKNQSTIQGKLPITLDQSVNFFTGEQKQHGN